MQLHDIPYSELTNQDDNKKDPLDNKTLVCSNKILQTIAIKFSIMFQNNFNSI